MTQMSIIFVCVFIAVISFSEAAQFGRYGGTQMTMSGFPQMTMPSFGMPSQDMMNQMFPMMLPKPSKMSEIKKLQEKMRLEHIKQQAKQRKLMLEQQKLMMQAMMAARKPKKPVAVEKPKSNSSTSKSSKSNSKKSDSSKRSKSSTSSSAASLESKPVLGALKPSQLMPLTPAAGLPGTNFQSVSYSTSSSSSNINGIPSATQSGHLSVNDNGKVTTQVF